MTINLDDVLCLDFEASGLGDKGFPIELGIVAVTSGQSWEWLIRPTDGWLSRDAWEPEAQVVHGLSLDDLQRDGLTVQQVAAELCAVVMGKRLYSDCTAKDGKWLSELYDAAGTDLSGRAVLEDFEKFAWQLAGSSGRRPDIAYVKAETEAWTKFPITHRALADARHNAEILRCIAPARRP
jgi:hypothetical protein